MWCGWDGQRRLGKERTEEEGSWEHGTAGASVKSECVWCSSSAAVQFLRMTPDAVSTHAQAGLVLLLARGFQWSCAAGEVVTSNSCGKEESSGSPRHSLPLCDTTLSLRAAGVCVSLTAVREHDPTTSPKHGSCWRGCRPWCRIVHLITPPHMSPVAGRTYSSWCDYAAPGVWDLITL